MTARSSAARGWLAPVLAAAAALAPAASLHAQPEAAENLGKVFAEEPRPSAVTAYAPPLDGIKIDGKLDDWPKDAVRYPVLTIYGVYGPTDLDDADLLVSPDLSASFMVGYNRDAGEVYVAVVVRDDKH